MKPIRWGILGLGKIARKFAVGLQSVPDATLVAVGSRAQVKAAAFAAEFNVPHVHGRYEALAADPEVDVVYVATPHPMHHEAALLCLRAGKAVLLEKPFTVNAKECEALIKVARRENIFLMEAMWMRFLPMIVQLREWLDRKVVGEPRMVTADFGFRAEWKPEDRLLNPALGGGALLDVGIYPLSFASMIFGVAPRAVTGLCHLGQTGVDEQSAVVLSYEGGELAVLACAVRTGTTHEARIFGTNGSIVIPDFWHCTQATLTMNGKPPETVMRPMKGNGYNYEAVEVGRCLRAGIKESPVMPLSETLEMMRTMDTLRRQWGLVYPGERQE
jgi:dihydrodiol dehydrogenase / D-xylose 1-dehydrogenase (NADP)